MSTAKPNLWNSRRPTNHALPLSTLTAALNRLAPLHLAESWDHVGLLSGHPDYLVQRILLAIDITPQVRDEALASATDLIFSYHPPIFQPLPNLRLENQEAPALAIELASHGVWVYSPHTALDTAPGGTNDVLAQKIGATVTGSLSHAPGQGQYLKLVTFVPESAVEQVADALFQIGCGQIGKSVNLSASTIENQQSKIENRKSDIPPYSHCSFRTPGTGTFFGHESTHPAVGQPGRLERVPEIRLETILPSHLTPAALAALRQAHPYEEPAFDLLQMQTPPEPVGLGRYATLDHPLTLAALAQRAKRALAVPRATLVGRPTQKIRTLAIVAGSCGRLPLDHARQPYDCVLTGEIKHHHMLAYAAAGKTVLALGHGNTERPVLTTVRNRLAQQFPHLDLNLSRADRDPFQII